MTVQECMPRCGPLCLGVGETLFEGPAACEGALYAPFRKGGHCPKDTRALRGFVPNPKFGGANKKGECTAPECAAVAGRVTKVKPSSPDRPVRVKAVRQEGAPAPAEEVVVEFAKNHIPPRSIVVGPLTLNCTPHSTRISVGAGSTITNVTVNCTGDCPLHVRLTRSHHETSTLVEGIKLRRNVQRGTPLTEAELCALIVSPVDAKTHVRDFIGRGHVTFKTHRGHNVAAANIDGRLTIDNPGPTPSTLTVLNSAADSGGVLDFEAPHGHVLIHNMTAILGVFGEEYLIEFFHRGKLTGYQAPSWMEKAIPVLAGIALAMIGSVSPDRAADFVLSTNEK